MAAAIINGVMAFNRLTLVIADTTHTTPHAFALYINMHYIIYRERIKFQESENLRLDDLTSLSFSLSRGVCSFSLVFLASTHTSSPSHAARHTPDKPDNQQVSMQISISIYGYGLNRI